MAASVDPTVPNASVTHLDGVAGVLTGLGHDVTLVMPRPSSGKAALDSATKPYRIDFARYGAEFGLPRFLSFPVHAPWLAWRAFKGEFDLVYIRSGVLSWILALAMRAASNVPVVTEHNGWICEELKAQGKPVWTQELMRRFQVWDASLSHVARCVTAGLARKLREAGLPDDKLLVAGNGTDLDRFRPMDRDAALSEMGLAKDRFYLGFIGSLAPWHGLTIAIAAMPAIFAANPKAHFLVAGDGQDRKPAEEMARQLGIADRITFFGHVPADRAPLVVNCFDLALAPFVTARNSAIGLSALKIRDYAATGRAILSTEIEGVAPPDDREWILMCPPDDADAFAQAAIAAMNDEAERARLGIAARAYAERHFGWTSIVRAVLDAAGVEQFGASSAECGA